MRYSVATLDMHFAEEWQADVFVQALFDLGFDTIDGNRAYIPTATLDAQRQALDALIDSTEGVTLLGLEDCPDENWNAAWEAEHPVQELPLGVKIVPHCAFGAGHHETTAMMIDALLETDLQGLRVLDHGTGTGVLAIFAKRRGASEVLAVDIDEKSVENARENAALNSVEIDVRLGSTVPEEGRFDLIMANIHRNILLANMPSYAAHLNPGGQLWLSGFYATDCDALRQATEENGLQITDLRANGEWQWMRCQNMAQKTRI